MTDNSFTGDDRISKPPEGAVLLKRIGSWAILFSQEEQNIYIISTDYHPEPFRMSLKQLDALRAALEEKRKPDSAPKRAEDSK